MKGKRDKENVKNTKIFIKNMLTNTKTRVIISKLIRKNSENKLVKINEKKFLTYELEHDIITKSLNQAANNIDN